MDAPWFINYNVPLQPVAPDQPENVQFMWFYGLHANNCGTYVNKPMTQCSGEEIMREFLYYCGLEDKIDEIMPHITAIPVVMPYITPLFRGQYDIRMVNVALKDSVLSPEYPKEQTLSHIRVGQLFRVARLVCFYKEQCEQTMGDRNINSYEPAEFISVDKSTTFQYRRNEIKLSLKCLMKICIA